MTTAILIVLGLLIAAGLVYLEARRRTAPPTCTCPAVEVMGEEYVLQNTQCPRHSFNGGLLRLYADLTVERWRKLLWRLLRLPEKRILYRQCPDCQQKERLSDR